MILAVGYLFFKKFLKTKNILIPLYSDHFSLFNYNLKNENIKKIYITASGGPFYSNKKININRVTLKEVYLILNGKWV